MAEPRPPRDRLALAKRAVPLLLGMSSACAHGSPSSVSVTCRMESVRQLPERVLDAFARGAGLAWRSQASPERTELDRWCAAVGPPLIRSGNRTPDPTDELAIVVWNTNVGGANVSGLIDDLEAGRYDARAPRHFALLLQEAHRRGDDVPASVPPMARSAGRIEATPPGGRREDIDRIAKRHGLHLVYVPSMRNGGEAEGIPEDRGNAILSTLPLEDPAALELPFEYQRRVAVSATMRGESVAGEAWTLELVSVHLDHRSPWARFGRSFGAGRTDQVQSIVEAFSGSQPAVVGGDFNTWWRGSNEEAIHVMSRAFPHRREPPDRGTVTIPWFWDRPVDHLFFRLPERWSARYDVVDETYGSDHRPLLAWVAVTRSHQGG